jgi:hypothetical protein
MAKEKFSEFTSKSFNDIKSDLINTTINLVGVDETNDDNFKINFLELLITASNLGTGASIFKNITDLKQFNFRKVKAASDKVSVTENANDISIDVEPSQMSLSELDGILPVSKGGTGLSTPNVEEDSLLLWDADQEIYRFVQFGSGIEIDEDTINATNSSILTTKGDLHVRTSSNDTRLPVGEDYTFLQADSNEAVGVKWVDINLHKLGKVAVDEDSVPDYLGTTSDDGVLRTDDSISFTDNGDYITLSVSKSNIDLSETDNSVSKFITNLAENSVNDIDFAKTIKTSDTNLNELAGAWELGTPSPDATGSHDTKIEVSINGVKYMLLAELVD